MVGAGTLSVNRKVYQGLTAPEVAERVKRGETNDYKPRVGRTYWDILRDNIFNIFNIVLFPLLIVIISFGEYAVAFFAGFSVVTNSILGLVQEVLAKRKLDQLAAQAEHEVEVWRDGKLISVPVAQIVKDDVIPIAPGDRLVVDGVVMDSDSLEMDESHLTGESDSILKERDNQVFSGSFCIAGAGTMVAREVGRNSTINKISTAATAYKNVLTPTQRRIASIVQICVVIMVIFGPMLWLANSVFGLSLLERVKNMVVFVTSIVPYGLVLVVVLALSIGAISITRHKTLIRRINAVESLANVTVLCFDKTGTITQNKLAVTQLVSLNGLPEEDIKNKLRLYTDNLAARNGTANALAAYTHQDTALSVPVSKLSEIPFNSTRKWGAIVLPEETLILGAPERVLNGDYQHREVAQQLSAEGLRVIAFARAKEAPHDGQLPAAEPVALVVLSDQVRDDIQETLESFRQQDIHLKVISGDNLETVKSIAQQAGLQFSNAYTGDQLTAMTDAEFEAAALQGDLFARVEPDTKRRIIHTLRQHGEHVAMVGDGVNDVPALKEADLAIVMNDGAQIAKEIGDILLLNNAMSTLPLAFREGVEITQTIFGTVKLFLVKAFYNVLLFIYVGFMALPFPITPIQINWITFGTVNIAATLIAFKIMRPAPMAKFRRDVLDFVITGAVIGSVAIAVLYAVVYFASGGSEDAARSALSIFVTLFGILVFWNVSGIDIFTPRTFLQHRGIFIFGFVMMLITTLGFYVMPRLFEFVRPSTDLLAQPTILLIVFLFELTMVVYSWAMRDRRLVNSLWTLFAP
jgi:cation-transporting P-type ATPase E